MLDQLGIEDICDRIESGESQHQIARNLTIQVSELNRWLHSDPQRSARVKQAMAESSESWLDRGTDALERAMAGEVDATAARAYAQECARRAAIRNPQYRDKPDLQVNVTNDAGSTPAANILAAAIQLARQAGLTQQLAGLVIEHAPQPVPEPLPAPKPE